MARGQLGLCAGCPKTWTSIHWAGLSPVRESKRKNPMKKIDIQQELHRLEESARLMGRTIGQVLEEIEPKKKRGFALMIFSFDGDEMTWISNVEREDMIKLLDEFKANL